MKIEARIAVLPPKTHLLELREIVLPDPGPHEVTVEQISFGVCHSQLDRIFDPTRSASMILGHESLARVVRAGSEVDYVSEGDLVFTTWIPRTPLEGRPPRPSSLTFAGGDVATTHNTYAWGTHATIDEQWVVKAPESVSRDLGSVIGCAVMTGAGAVLNSVSVQTGDTVAVWGVGGVGLCSVAAAAVLGAERVIAVDVNDAKLALAARFGATDGVNAQQADAVAVIRELTAGEDGIAGVDYAFDCTGIGENLSTSLAALRPGIRGSGLRGGTDVMVGIPRQGFHLDSFDLLNGEKTLTATVGGSADPQRDFATFVEWSADGRFDPALLVTDRFCLDDINDAVEALHSGQVLGRAVVDLGRE